MSGDLVSFIDADDALEWVDSQEAVSGAGPRGLEYRNTAQVIACDGYPLDHNRPPKGG